MSSPMSSPRHQSSAFAHGHPRRSLCSSLPISAFTSAQLRATLAVAVIVLACRTGPLDKNLFDLLQNLVTDRQSWEDVNEEDGTPITFSKTVLKEFSDDVDFVQGVLDSYKGFYGNAQSGN